MGRGLGSRPLFSVLGFGFTFWGFGCVPFSTETQRRAVKKIGPRPEVRTQKAKAQRKSFPDIPINKRKKERKERKTNKRIEEKQQLEPFKTQIHSSLTRFQKH